MPIYTIHLRLFLCHYTRGKLNEFIFGVRQKITSSEMRAHTLARAKGLIEFSCYH